MDTRTRLNVTKPLTFCIQFIVYEKLGHATNNFHIVFGNDMFRYQFQLELELQGNMWCFVQFDTIGKFKAHVKHSRRSDTFGKRQFYEKYNFSTGVFEIAQMVPNRAKRHIC